MTALGWKRKTSNLSSRSLSQHVTPRLVKAFGEKYSLTTAKGKLDLQKDIATLRLACENKIPQTSPSQSDRELFTSLLEKQRKVINEIHVPRDLPFSANRNQSKTEITLAVSPLRTERRKKRSRSTTSDSSEDSSNERWHKRRNKRSHSRKKSTRRKKSSRKKRKHYSSSSSESDIADKGLSSYKCNAPINGLPQDGGGGQPQENLTFSGFQVSISPPLGLH